MDGAVGIVEHAAHLSDLRQTGIERAEAGLKYGGSVGRRFDGLAADDRTGLFDQAVKRLVLADKIVEIELFLLDACLDRHGIGHAFIFADVRDAIAPGLEASDLFRKGNRIGMLLREVDAVLREAEGDVLRSVPRVTVALDDAINEGRRGIPRLAVGVDLTVVDRGDRLLAGVREVFGFDGGCGAAVAVIKGRADGEFLGMVSAMIVTFFGVGKVRGRGDQAAAASGASSLVAASGCRLCR